MKAAKVVPVAAEERILPEQVPQDDWNVALGAVVAVLCVFSCHCCDLKLLRFGKICILFGFAVAVSVDLNDRCLKCSLIYKVGFLLLFSRMF